VTNHPSTPRRLAAVLAVTGLLVLGASSASAATPPPGDKSFSQNGSTAEVDAGGCADDGVLVTCTERAIQVFVGKMTDGFSGVSHLNQLCVNLGTYAFDSSTGELVGEPVFEHGCVTDLPNGAVKVDSKLVSASVATTSLTVEQESCDKESCTPGPTRTVTVAGSWTGFGPLQTAKSRSRFDDGTCRYDDSFKGSGRSATFDGTLDGTSISTSDLGYLSTGKSTFRSRCSEG
jgi:hypothetical protein